MIIIQICFTTEPRSGLMTDSGLTRITRIYTKLCSTRNYHTKYLLCDEEHENHPDGSWNSSPSTASSDRNTIRMVRIHSWNSCLDKKHRNIRNLNSLLIVLCFHVTLPFPLPFRRIHLLHFSETIFVPLPQPLNRHRRRRWVDVVEVGKPTSSMSIFGVLV